MPAEPVWSKSCFLCHPIVSMRCLHKHLCMLAIAKYKTEGFRAVIEDIASKNSLSLQVTAFEIKNHAQKWF